MSEFMRIPETYYNMGTLALFVLVIAGCRPSASSHSTAVASPPVKTNSPRSTPSTASDARNPLVGTWALNRPDERPPQFEVLRMTFQSDGTGHDLIGPFRWSTDSGNKRLILDYTDAKNGTGVKIDLDWAGSGPANSVNIHFVESALLADQTLYRQR
jgi:hypothetical protein